MTICVIGNTRPSNVKFQADRMSSNDGQLVISNSGQVVAFYARGEWTAAYKVGSTVNS